MVERMHRHLKGALKVRLDGPEWMDELPWVLLGLRSAWREGSSSMAAEMLYSAALRLPGQFIPGVEAHASSQDWFVLDLQARMISGFPYFSS